MHGAKSAGDPDACSEQLVVAPASVLNVNVGVLSGVVAPGLPVNRTFGAVVSTLKIRESTGPVFPAGSTPFTANR